MANENSENDGKPINVGDIETYHDFIADSETEQLMNEEIASAPRARQNYNSELPPEDAEASPATSGGDVDADWQDAVTSGSQSFGGHEATPDQSDVEGNAVAMGFTFEDNQEIDILEKIGKRDRDRFELDEDSKGPGDMI